MIALVLLAGGVGAVLRYLVSALMARRSQANSFPWAVLAVNVVGSAVAGVVLGLHPDAEQILLTGFCAALTTYSTFSVETVQLLLAGRVRPAVLSVAANVVLGIGAAALGYLVVR
ncbi:MULTISPECIES: fluoride efflux transporter CrcB [unclassified Cryobacterium]|uniref:fluoride efflux transporter CrcB n=1 Tax=unclassified Cryobacterium TaxID=2649013 RepID=UPI0014484688|nr:MULTISPECIES: fluoride efflux transporter CrcB [unclassified Cryobacterium]